MLLFYTVTRGPAYLIFPIISLSPVITIAMSFLLMGERTGRLGRAAFPGEIVIEVEDHGRGIAGDADGGPHFGLRMMRARAEEVGGTVDIGSRPGEGTRIVARLPVEGAR